MATRITSKALKTARERARETQEQFAKRFGVDQSTYSRWEKAGPPKKGPARRSIERELEGMEAA